MKALNLATLILVIIGGLNWGLVGLFEFNLVAALFGPLSRLVYILVGLAAIYQLYPLSKAFSTDEPEALRNRPIRR